MDSKPTKMIFRTWKSGEVIALMPELPSDLKGYTCESYQHVGQHGSALPGLVTSHTRPATRAEAAALAIELHSIGYLIKIRQRETPQMRQTRMNAAKRLPA